MGVRVNSAEIELTHASLEAFPLGAFPGALTLNIEGATQKATRGMPLSRRGPHRFAKMAWLDERTAEEEKIHWQIGYLTTQVRLEELL
jgi:hypothetical protein